MDEAVKQGGKRSGWRLLFLALEALLVFGCLCLKLAEHFGLAGDSWGEALLVTGGLAVLISWPMLFFVAPFFTGKLKRVALIGWLMAFSLVVWAAIGSARV